MKCHDYMNRAIDFSEKVQIPLRRDWVHVTKALEEELVL